MDNFLFNIDYSEDFIKLQKDIRKSISKYKTNLNIKFVKKIIFNDPCVILIDTFGDKTIVRIQENEPYDMEFGYYMVLAKYLSSNATYSELLGHIYDNSFEYGEQRLNVLTSFLMGKLGVKRCRKIAFERVVNILELIHENPKNYTINFKEVLNV